MKSVGELMAIDRKFEAAMGKALRMVYGDTGCDGFDFVSKEMDNLEQQAQNAQLAQPSDMHLFVVAAALQSGYRVNRIHAQTHFEPWLLRKFCNFVVTERLVAVNALEDVPRPLRVHAKQCGLSDLQLARVLNAGKLGDGEGRAARAAERGGSCRW